MDIQVSFPGGKRVNAQVGNFVIETDQPPEFGGNGAAPAPYDLFLASIGTCAGIYVLGFCQARGIPTEGLRLLQHNELDPTSKLLRTVRLELSLPPGFPEKYRAAIVKAAEGCKVKKTLASAPSFEVVVTNLNDPLSSPHLEECSACASA
ncbi:MAG TPA: OsmC family protein [Polyangiaceae bacterium]|jgi:ribosomal protein S12 methylthiotransferase accessory factor|nr:OsmC family protein [Polyangiaceae bacterium]